MFRKSELSHLRCDQTHIVLKCSTSLQQRAFLDAIDDLEKGFPGLLRAAFIELNGETEDTASEVTFCRVPETDNPLFMVQKVNRDFVISDWSDEAQKLFGAEFSEQKMRNQKVLDFVHPSVKTKAESSLKKCFAVIQVNPDLVSRAVLLVGIRRSEVTMAVFFQANGIGQEEWVTCGLQFKSSKKSLTRKLSVSSPIGSDGFEAVFPIMGPLLKRNHENDLWEEKVYELYQNGNLMYYSASMQGYSSWDVSDCTLLLEVGEDEKHGLADDCYPFKLQFEDGRTFHFAALSEADHLAWVDALQTVCSITVIPVDMM
jgi:hypothetical protein